MAILQIVQLSQEHALCMMFQIAQQSIKQLSDQTENIQRPTTSRHFGQQKTKIDKQANDEIHMYTNDNETEIHLDINKEPSKLHNLQIAFLSADCWPFFHLQIMTYIPWLHEL